MPVIPLGPNSRRPVPAVQKMLAALGIDTVPEGLSSIQVRTCHPGMHMLAIWADDYSLICSEPVFERGDHRLGPGSYFLSIDQLIGLDYVVRRVMSALDSTLDDGRLFILRGLNDRVSIARYDNARAISVGCTYRGSALSSAAPSPGLDLVSDLVVRCRLAGQWNWRRPPARA